MSTNVANLKQIGGGHRKKFVDLIWNDPGVLFLLCGAVMVMMTNGSKDVHGSSVDRNEITEKTHIVWSGYLLYPVQTVM